MRELFDDENSSDKDTLKCIGKLKYDPSYLYINKITTIDTTEQDCVQLVTNNGQKISMDPTSFQNLKEKIKSLLL
eukprot:gene11550-4801_t